MLGNIAKKLRLLGFDAKYSSDMEDKNLIENARTLGRTIITKDEELTKIAEKQNVSTILITETDEVEQFLQINQKINLGNVSISGDTSRCPLCNGELQKFEDELIPKDIPKGVLENIKKFWQCRKCRKVYWEGSHIKNLQKFAEKLNERF